MESEEQNVEQFKCKARLPEFIVPKQYDLFLKPDLSSACKFAGSVRISVEVKAPTRFVVLNAADLDVRDGSVGFKKEGDSKEIRPVEIITVEQDEILIIRFDESLPQGEGVLSIDFEGILSDKMKGFYKSVYEYNGEKKNMAVTQFEPADARRCFPCWDEPSFKAKFRITLEVPSDLVALSNMPVLEEKRNGPSKTLYFQESPIMSTYLVAVVVGMFDYVEGRSSEGTMVRVYCQVGKSDQGKFALHVAVKTLDLYKKYFAEPYPLPKLDMVAIPDFAAGAMENYGLVTYRETALLFDEKHSAASNKQRVAVVVAHELAHQWFGNLVTMEWWTHLWLNEGFATWVSYLSADSLFPEWNVWTQFLSETTSGLRLDALDGSHPIEVEVNHASEIDEIFDEISYRKGASVIRMLQSYLGAETFQRALASYINKFAYSNAKTEDLWAVLEKESGEPVNKLMSSWTKQQGYPVVSVKKSNGVLELNQTQFLSSGAVGTGNWIVPVTLCTGSYENQKKFLLEEKDKKINISDINGKWIKLNVNQTGFFRVSYDKELAAGLKLAIESKQLNSSDRYGILDDYYALCMACKQNLSSLISLMAAYKDETEYTVLSHIISISLRIVSMVADAAPELLTGTKAFFVGLLEPFAAKIGWDPKEGDKHSDAMLRGELLTALSELGHSRTVSEAKRRFEAFVGDRNTSLLPPDTRRAAYVAVMQTTQSGNKSGFESLLKIYRESDLSQEKVRVLSALATCPDPSVVVEVLNFLLTPEVRNQDVVNGLGGISFESCDVAWTWLKENWEYIAKTYGSGFLITRFISYIVSLFSSDEKANEVEEFFASRTKPFIARTIKQSVEKIRINANWARNIKSDKSLGDVLNELLK
ncbi:hypothetical protein LUZ60_012357 [Juncus effusus]|nr:hypothetical protein LUZ60_012357 [Juncus effusus]